MADVVLNVVEVVEVQGEVVVPGATTISELHTIPKSVGVRKVLMLR
jgi:hypothetical protein